MERTRTRGQAVIEYLVVVAAVILAIVAVSNPYLRVRLEALYRQAISKIP